MECIRYSEMHTGLWHSPDICLGKQNKYHGNLMVVPLTISVQNYPLGHQSTIKWAAALGIEVRHEKAFPGILAWGCREQRYNVPLDTWLWHHPGPDSLTDKPGGFVEESKLSHGECLVRVLGLYQKWHSFYLCQRWRSKEERLMQRDVENGLEKRRSRLLGPPSTHLVFSTIPGLADIGLWGAPNACWKA